VGAGGCGGGGGYRRMRDKKQVKTIRTIYKVNIWANKKKARKSNRRRESRVKGGSAHCTMNLI